MSLTPREQDLARAFDFELQRANLPLGAFHTVSDAVGCPRGKGNRGSSVEGLELQEAAERARVGCRFGDQPRWKVLFAIPLIYLPILLGVLPLALCALLVRTHLTLVGGHELKSYWSDFVPAWVTHRYTYGSQIVPVKLFQRYWFLRWLAGRRVFWIFNCKLYCPLSVALLAYVLYLVKIVEQWWCPFGHGKKQTYADAPIDKSLWHATGDENLLHPDDRKNPSWNEEGHPM